LRQVRALHGPSKGAGYREPDTVAVLETSIFGMRQ
jgi:hypothetical protein